MPVLSPRRSSAGTYRSSYSSSIDRPYYNSPSSLYSPRIQSYSERYTTKSYTDSDGRRVYSRSGSITEDGVTTRFHEESREGSTRRDSTSRDSGISSIRENSILDTPRRENSISKLDRSDLSALNVAESVDELRRKYSPANYIPACQRKNDNIARSKSINDIGLPPVERADSKILKKKVNNGLNNSLGLSINNTNTNNVDNMVANDDDNGNRASVAEIRKKFDINSEKTPKNSSALIIEGNPIKISDNHFKKQDRLQKVRSSPKPYANGEDKKHSDSKSKENDKSVKIDSAESKSDKNIGNIKSKLNVSTDSVKEENGTEIVGNVNENGVESVSPSRNSNHTNGLLSKDFQKGDDAQEGVNGEDSSVTEPDRMDDVYRNGRSYYIEKDISTSPRLNRNALSQAGTSSGPSTNNITSNSILRDRNSLERDRRDGDEDRGYSRSLAPPSVKQLGLNGLKNIGNTCFMNSVVQCLSNTKLLLEYLRKDDYTADINTTVSSMKGALIKAFTQVIKELWSEDSMDRVVNTVALKSQIQRFAPRFMGYAQQDAQEFLRYLLEGLHEDVNRVTEKPKPILTEIDETLSDAEKAAESWQRYLRMDNSKIVDIFVGQLKSTLKCTHCGHSSVTFDPFWDLSLPIPQRAGQLRLSQCLDHFTREETLDGDEKPTCSKCKERRKCTKSFSIQKFPKILVIHLKRFSPTERFRGKLSVTIDFPLEGLDMRQYSADSVTDSRYNLYAISNHSGTTYSGHYTAYCRHPYSHSWHEYNDSRVSSISSKSIVSGEAYVLFYELESQKSHL